MMVMNAEEEIEEKPVATRPVWVVRPNGNGRAEAAPNSRSGTSAQGSAFLRVVAYPWGVDFEIWDGGEDR